MDGRTMNQMAMKHEQDEIYDHSGSWGLPSAGYQSPHVPSPAHEFAQFEFMSPPMGSGHSFDPTFQRHLPPYSHGLQHSPHQQYPAVWPSMLTNPSPPMTSLPMMAHPSSIPTTTFATPQPLPPLITTQVAQPQPGQRRTLTDQDRRRMCMYHEEHPSVKQTEIGAMFGVERSTVSKVLRQKEKYLAADDGSKSPLRRAKGKLPDVEKALGVWARNHQRQGRPLTDSAIREKARVFAASVGGTESHLKVNNSSWLEKFKQKNHLAGSKARKGGASHDGSELDSAIASGAQTPNGISPISPGGVGSPEQSSPEMSRGAIKMNSPDLDPSPELKLLSHSRSMVSLESFSDHLSPSSQASRPSLPSSASYNVTTAGDTYTMAEQDPLMATSGGNSYRPRSQTYPMVGIETSAVSNDTYNQDQLDSILGNSALETPNDEYPDRSLSIASMSSTDLAQALHSHTVSVSNTPLMENSPSVMGPPPNPLQPMSTNASAIPSPVSPPTKEEARRALALVMKFLTTQPGVVDPQEFMLMGKLEEKLRVQGTVGELPGGMHSIDIDKSMSRKRSIHSL